MNVVIDHEKLAKLIATELRDLFSLGAVSGEVCIGRVSGVEIHLVTTRSESDSMGSRKAHCCVKAAP